MISEAPNEACTFDPSQIHHRNLELKNDILDVVIVKELRMIIEASWEYCRMGIQAIALRDPVFTQKGDLICELDLVEGMLRNDLLVCDA